MGTRLFEMSRAIESVLRFITYKAYISVLMIFRSCIQSLDAHVQSFEDLKLI